jgi:fructose-1,6-bisphosphatase/inositol monophosphatase family enzyme
MFSLVAHYVVNFQDQPEMANGIQLHARNQSEAAMSNLLQRKMNIFPSKALESTLVATGKVVAVVDGVHLPK